MCTINPIQLITLITKAIMTMLWPQPTTAPAPTPPLDWVTQEMFRRAWIEARDIPICFPDDVYAVEEEAHNRRMQLLIFQVVVLVTMNLIPVLYEAFSGSSGDEGDPNNTKSNQKCHCNHHHHRNRRSRPTKKSCWQRKKRLSISHLYRR